MSSNSPEEIQEDIERTRQDLRENVDALQEKVSIKGAASRSADRVKESVSSMKDTIMGSADSAKESVASAGESAGQLPAKARRTTQGNPLAVGLGAFAVGWLIGSLIPASQREREAVEKVNEKADLVAPVQEVVTHAQEKGKQALQEVAEEAKSGAQQVKESVQS